MVWVPFTPGRSQDAEVDSLGVSFCTAGLNSTPKPLSAPVTADRPRTLRRRPFDGRSVARGQPVNELPSQVEPRAPVYPESHGEPRLMRNALPGSANS